MCNDGIINVFIMQADSPAPAPVHQHQPSPTNTSPQWFLAWDGTGRNIIITAFCFMLTFCAHFVQKGNLQYPNFNQWQWFTNFQKSTFLYVLWGFGGLSMKKKWTMPILYLENHIFIFTEFNLMMTIKWLFLKHIVGFMNKYWTCLALSYPP